MTTRYCYYNSNMYVVDHVVRLDRHEPFKPFVYKGKCEVSMHLQGSRQIHVYELVNPVILNKEQAVKIYPEWFI